MRTLATAHQCMNPSFNRQSFLPQMSFNRSTEIFRSRPSLLAPHIHLSSEGTRFPVSKSQRRPQNNVSGDTDDMFDELLEKYGKVVFQSNDQKSPSEEANDDAESLSFAVALAKVANEVKGADIQVLFVKPLVYWTHFFIIATAYNMPQIDAMRFMAKFKYYAVAIGRTPGVYTNWLECKAQIHEFREPIFRGFQNLEEANEFVTKHAVHSTTDHSTPLLTSSKRGSSSSTPTCMISQTDPLQREVVQTQHPHEWPPTSVVLPITHIILAMFGCTIFLLVLILTILILIFYHM